MKKIIKNSIGVSVVFAVLALPVIVSAASETSNTTVNATIDSSISVSSSGAVALPITPTGAGSATSASGTATVSTNNATGYNLTLANNDTTTSLVSADADTITAHTGTQGSPTTLAVNTWGYRVDGLGGFGAGPTSAQNNSVTLSGLWAGVPTSGSPNTIKTTATTATNDATTVWFGASANTTKPNGVYEDTVVYTATTNL